MRHSFTRQAARISIAIGVASIAYLAASQSGHAPLRRQPRPGPPNRLRDPMRDYSMRSGFPRGVEASRGLAADAVLPADMLTPDLLKPWADTPRL